MFNFLIETFWDISYVKIKEELAKQKLSENEISPLFCLNWFIEDISRQPESRIFKKVTRLTGVKKTIELLCVTILSYLECRNYIGGDNTLRILGQLFRNTIIEFQDETMLCFELLTSAGFSGMYTQGVTSPLLKEALYKRIISEVFSFIPVKLKKGSAEEWNSYQISDEFACFVTLAKNAWTSCREFVENILFILFSSLDDTKAIETDDFEKAYELLPFSKKPNYLMGVAILYLFNPPKTEIEKIDGEHPFKLLMKFFPIAHDIVADLKRAYSWWRSVIEMITILHSFNAIEQAQYDQFMGARQYLDEKLEMLGIIKDMI